MKNPSPSSSPSSSETKKARRLARQRSRERSRIIKTAAIVGALAALVILVLAVTANQRAAADEPIEGVQTFTNPDRGHTTEPVDYAQEPPAGGLHHPSWQNCGVYTQPIRTEHAVHSLEHGAIWITYLPDLPADQVERLQEITRQSGYRLMSPYPGQPSPIVLSAWGYQLQLEQAGDPRLMAFIERYEQNPQGPEPGASCTGGVGEPG